MIFENEILFIGIEANKTINEKARSDSIWMSFAVFLQPPLRIHRHSFDAYARHSPNSHRYHFQLIKSNKNLWFCPEIMEIWSFALLFHFAWGAVWRMESALRYNVVGISSNKWPKQINRKLYSSFSHKDVKVFFIIRLNFHFLLFPPCCLFDFWFDVLVQHGMNTSQLNTASFRQQFVILYVLWVSYIINRFSYSARAFASIELSSHWSQRGGCWFGVDFRTVGEERKLLDKLIHKCQWK